MQSMTPRHGQQKIRKEIEIEEVQFPQIDRAQEEITELEQLLLERTETINECKT